MDSVYPNVTYFSMRKAVCLQASKFLCSQFFDILSLQTKAHKQGSINFIITYGISPETTNLRKQQIEKEVVTKEVADTNKKRQQAVEEAKEMHKYFAEEQQRLKIVALKLLQSTMSSNQFLWHNAINLGFSLGQSGPNRVYLAYDIAIKDYSMEGCKYLNSFRI